VIRGIHLKTTNNRRRFAGFVDEGFKVLYALLKEIPALVQLLSDQGEGSAPPKFMAAVELGLRNIGAISVHTMGSGSMQSKRKWAVRGRFFMHSHVSNRVAIYVSICA
jgi:hypothetical protein